MLTRASARSHEGSTLSVPAFWGPGDGQISQREIESMPESGQACGRLESTEGSRRDAARSEKAT